MCLYEKKIIMAKMEEGQKQASTFFKKVAENQQKEKSEENKSTGCPTVRNNDK